MAELPRYYFMKHIQFEVKMGEGREKQRSQENRLMKQPRESARAGKKGDTEIRNFKDKGTFNQVKFNLRELALICNNNKHKRATWEFYLLTFPTRERRYSGLGHRWQLKKPPKGKTTFLWYHSSMDQGCKQRGYNNTICDPFSILSIILLFLLLCSDENTNIFPSTEFFSLTVFSLGHIRKTKHNTTKSLWIKNQASTYLGSIMFRPNILLDVS